MPQNIVEMNRGESLTALESDDALWEGEPGAVAVKADSPWQTPVYECCESALWRKRLVLTPYMLVDRLKACAELAAEVRDEELPAAAVRNRADLLADEVDRLLALLWRSGLWIDTPTEERESCDGRAYQVIARPFTDDRARE
jgi:hypothetical protein